MIEKKLTDTKDIAANAVSKPGKIPTIFHVVPETHYGKISTEYKQQPESGSFKISKITEQQIIYFDSTNYKEVTTKKTKKAAPTKAFELVLKTNPLCDKFEPKNWKTEKFLIHESYFNKSRYEYVTEKLSNEAYKKLVERLKIK